MHPKVDVTVTKVSEGQSDTPERYRVVDCWIPSRPQALLTLVRNFISWIVVDHRYHPHDTRLTQGRF